MSALIKFIEFHHPKNVLTNEMLGEQFPDWSVSKIYEKTGINNRYISDENECASDLAYHAINKLLISNDINKDDIDYLILCTQSSDYKLPTTACILQHRVGLSNNVGAIDINQGCSGFVYGLGLAKGLIDSGQAKGVLLVTADTYSKYINKADRSVRTLFGDAACATFITDDLQETEDSIGPFIYGTDGKGAENLIVPHGGSRNPINEDSFIESTDESGNKRHSSNLYMNGAEVFAFTLKSVKNELNKLYLKSGLSIDDIDHFVFHQPNKFMLDTLRKACKIPEEKFHRSYQNYGNTVSSTIPIGLNILMNERKLKKGDTVLVIGFGVGYSSAATLIKWGY